MPLPNDFTGPAVIRTVVPHQPGAGRTDKGSPPVARADYDADGVALGAASTLDDEWRSAARVLATTEREWAELHARHGPGGQADAHRRALRGAIGAELRDAARRAGTRLTDGAAEDMACADERYTAYLSEAEQAIARYAVLTSQRARAKETMEWCRARAYLAGAEARLMPQGGGV
jgi:hypothetical protein